MAATLTGTTTNTQQQKKQNILPLQDENNPNQQVPLVQQSNQQAAQNGLTTPSIQPQQVNQSNAIQQASNQSLLQANQQAQQGFQSPTAQLTTQQTQALLNDPNQGMNFDAYRRNQLSQLDSQQADAIESARQGLAGASGSSLAQAGLMDIALKGIEQKANLTNELDTNIANQRSQNLLNALAAGRDTTGMEQGISSQNLNALLAAREGSEGELNRQTTTQESALDRTLQLTMQTNDTAANTALTELKAKLDSGLLTQEQDWKTAEAALNRAAETALQNGDIQGQLQIEQLKGELEAQSVEAQQTWASAERVATQAYTSQERLSSQDFQNAQLYIKQGIDQAAAEQDFERQKYLKSQEQQLQLKMQTNDMQYGEKMAYLNMQLQEAQANNNVNREKEILTFQQGQEMERIRQEQGFEASMQYSQQQFQQAMQKGEFEHAETALLTQQNFEAEEAIKDRAVEYAQIALQQQGVNFEQEMAQYNAIAQSNPEQAQQYLKTMLEGKFDLKITDSLETAKQALAADFELQKEQYALSHPEDPNLTEFYNFYNSSMFGETSVNTLVNKVTNGVFNAQEIKNDPEKLEAAKQSAMPWTPEIGGFGTHKEITNLPEMNTPVLLGNMLCMRISDSTIISLDSFKTFNIKTLIPGI